MLALVVNPSFGAPAFVARMIPVHNLTTEFLYDKVILILLINPDTGINVSPKWKDLITIYKTTKLDYHNTFSNNFEKQKVHLVVNLFNNKTCVALSQREMDDTHIFVKNVTKLWIIMNIKSFDALSQRKT